MSVFNAICAPSPLVGDYFRNKLPAITPADLTPELVRDVREFTAAVTECNGLSDGDWPERLVEFYRDFDGTFINRNGRPVYLDTEILFRRDRERVLLSAEVLEWQDLSDPEDFGDSVDPRHPRTWYRDNLMSPAGQRVRIDNPERWVVVINILKAAYPGPALMWGKRAANDN